MLECTIQMFEGASGSKIEILRVNEREPYFCGLRIIVFKENTPTMFLDLHPEDAIAVGTMLRCIGEKSFRYS